NILTVPLIYYLNHL
ncbi:Hypothetical protein SRAE_2000242300, partial [Strongyloides ratti]